jgi:type IV pilus assembly protein PilV
MSRFATHGKAGSPASTGRRLSMPVRRPGRFTHSGMSLIEVLVATLVVALGILAMVAMQLNATRFTKTAEVRTLGTLLVNDLADRMRANRGDLKTGGYVYATPYPATGAVTEPAVASNECNAPDKDCSTADATGLTALAAADKADWLRRVYFALPNGSARIGAYDANHSAVDVWLIWMDPDGDKSEMATNECPSNAVAAAATGSTAVTPRCLYFRINV